MCRAPGLGSRVLTRWATKGSPLRGPAAPRPGPAFPGGPAPAIVVVKAPDIASVKVRQAFASFEQAAQRSGEIGQPIQVTVYRG